MGHKQPPHVKITLTIPEQLLQEVDLAAEHDYTTRSDLIRVALLEYLRLPGRLTGEPDFEMALKVLQRRKSIAASNKMMKKEGKLGSYH